MSNDDKPGKENPEESKEKEDAEEKLESIIKFGSEDGKFQEPQIVEAPKPAKAVFTVDQIREKAGDVDIQEISKEVFAWLITNVVDYIDNAEKMFRLYITVDASSDMPMTDFLQKLYLSIPDVEDPDSDEQQALWEELMNIVDGSCAGVKTAMQNDKENLDKLFQAMIYYYEMTGYSKAVGPVIQQMAGKVSINEFMFDPIEQTMEVKQTKFEKDEDGNVIGETKEVVKQVHMPAAFGLEFELDFWPAKKATSLY